MKLFKFYNLSETILIGHDGSSEYLFLTLDFNFCNNFYNIEIYLI